MANETKACSTSIRLHRLPLTFNLSLQLKMLIKANYNQQMRGTIYYVIFLLLFIKTITIDNISIFKREILYFWQNAKI